MILGDIMNIMVMTFFNLKYVGYSTQYKMELHLQ